MNLFFSRLIEEQDLINLETFLKLYYLLQQREFPPDKITELEDLIKKTKELMLASFSPNSKDSKGLSQFNYAFPNFDTCISFSFFFFFGSSHFFV